ncbi:ultraviolet-sensitive opsin [Egretta garzetta]|uniref:ultraviolet-sensitive opsin n=1 Tax=Egretta garzetta TaxID=188379 RepID=UPI00051F0B45|nr:ultraviolet-sensitive opsin [Egretta garzetta]
MSGEEEFYLFKNGSSSLGPWDGPQYHIAPRWAFYLQTAFMGFVFLVGTPLNAIVLVVTVKYKKLRQPLNYILVNISFSSFISCIFSVFTVFISSSQGYFVFGKHMCSLEGFVGATGGLVTGWSLAFLAFERYIVICKPFGNFRFSSKHALMVVVATWVIGVGVAIPPFFGWSSYVPYAALAMYMVNNRNHGLDLRLVTIPAFFSKSACVYNPIIYCFMNKQFRVCIMETVCGKPMTDDSDISSSAQRTEVSSVGPTAMTHKERWGRERGDAAPSLHPWG